MKVLQNKDIRCKDKFERELLIDDLKYSDFFMNLISNGGLLRHRVNGIKNSIFNGSKSAFRV